MAKITLDRVGKRYGQVVAVDELTLEVRDRELLTLVGPSGCGKSTTLYLIAGLEPVSAGEICFDDAPVTRLPARERDVALVFQNYALYPHMSVYENMAFNLRIRRVPREEIDRRVRRAARVLGIEELLDRRPAQLSGGQQQRAALGRAIVRAPQVFLLDEPLSNLDARMRISMRAEIKRLQRELNVTTVFVTHDQEEAMTISDRIAVMHRGRIEQLGTPEEIYDAPASLYVAGFVGSPPINLIRGRMRSAGDFARLESEVGALVLSPAFAGRMARAALPDPCVLGVRPEDVVLRRDGGPEALAGRIDLLQPVGAVTYVEVLVGDAVRLTASTAPGAFRPGERVAVTLNEAKFHLFDPATERRLPL